MVQVLLILRGVKPDNEIPFYAGRKTDPEHSKYFSTRIPFFVFLSSKPSTNMWKKGNKNLSTRLKLELSTKAKRFLSDF